MRLTWAPMALVAGSLLIGAAGAASANSSDRACNDRYASGYQYGDGYRVIPVDRRDRDDWYYRYDRNPRYDRDYRYDRDDRAYWRDRDDRRWRLREEREERERRRIEEEREREWRAHERRERAHDYWRYRD